MPKKFLDPKITKKIGKNWLNWIKKCIMAQKSTI